MICLKAIVCQEWDAAWKTPQWNLFGEPYNVKEGYETFEALQQTIKEYSVL